MLLHTEGELEETIFIVKRSKARWMDSQFNDGKRSAFYKDYWLSAICVVAHESLPSLGSGSFLELKEWNNSGDGL